MTTPTPVTSIDAPLNAIADHLRGHRVAVTPELRRSFADVCAGVSETDTDRAEAGRDWWPLAIGWAVDGEVPARPEVIVRPADTAQVAAVLDLCHRARVPVTPAGGRSGVCGASVPLFGGVALDLCGLAGVAAVDPESLTADIRAGTFGPDVEASLRTGNDLTLGHWPQSMDLSTVGGWLACRGAGQYSNRYGKIEDMVIGLEVVLADGRVVRTGGRGPRSATGPDLTQLFVGSEGTLGVITEGRFRVHPVPEGEARRVFGFASFASGLDACRRILRRGATPAVLRLYDQTESARSFDRPDTCVLIVLDEADPGLVDATLAIVDAECGAAETLDPGLVGRWLEHRNDVSALAPLWRSGIVVDTVEVAARWAALPDLYHAVLDAVGGLEGTLVVSSHQSHAYTDGACLYFTFAGRGPSTGDGTAGRGPSTGAGTAERGPSTGAGTAGRDADRRWAEDYYREAWDSVTGVTRAAGGAISHHHGIGLNRARFLPGSLGPAFGVLATIKQALDPHGILNPGKLGLPSSFGEVPLAVSILVVDVGTSGVRGAVVRPDGAVEHIHRVPVLPDTPFPGLVEFDAVAMADAVTEVATRCLADVGQVDAVGIANQRASTILWDRGTGVPVGPGIGWQDLRTVGTCLELQGQGIRVAPNASATKLAALLDVADPDRSRAERGELAFGTVDTWVAWTLSDRHLHVTDASNAGVTGLLRGDATGWDPALLEALRIPAALLPTIVDSSGVVGQATNLTGRPPIAGMAGDQQASLIGQGCTRPGQAKATFGTGGMLDQCVGGERPPHPARGPAGTIPIIAWQRGSQPTWGVEAIMLSAGTCVEWLRDDLGIIDSAAASAEVAAQCEDTDDVWFVPALLGLGTPVWDFGARGTFTGITRGTGRPALVRAVLEGIAHRGADLLEAAESDSGLAVGALRIDGGMSANPVFTRALTEACGRTIEIAPVLEATTLGAAYLAGMAVGTWADEDEVAAAWSPREVLEPRRDEGERAARRSRWLEARSRAERTIPELSALDF